MLCLGLLLPHSCVFTFCTELSWPYKSVCRWGLCQSPISGLFKPLLTQLWCSWVDPHTEERIKVHLQIAKAKSQILCVVNPCTTFFHFSISLSLEDALMTHSFHWNHTPEWSGPWVRRANLVFQIIHNLFSNWTWEQNLQVAPGGEIQILPLPKGFPEAQASSRFSCETPYAQWPSQAKPFAIFFFWPGWSQKFLKKGRAIENILRKEENLEIHRAESSGITVVNSHPWNKPKTLMEFSFILRTGHPISMGAWKSTKTWPAWQHWAAAPEEPSFLTACAIFPR